jgi:hypothetical protein
MDCAVSSGSDEDGSASAAAPSPQSASSAGSVPTHAAVNAASTASVGRESWDVVIVWLERERGNQLWANNSFAGASFAVVHALGSSYCVAHIHVVPLQTSSALALQQQCSARPAVRGSGLRLCALK